MGLRRGNCRDRSELAVTLAPAKAPRVFFAIKSSGGVDRGRHLARLKLEILEFFGFQNRDYFGAPPPPEWLRIGVPEGAGNYPARRMGDPAGFLRVMNKSQTILRSAAAHQLERDAAAERADRARCRVGGFGDRKLPTARSRHAKKAAPSPGPALLGRLLAT